MKVANFRGRKNARRVNSLARHQKSLQEAELFAVDTEQYMLKYKSEKGTEEYNDAYKKHEQHSAYYFAKVQRIKKAIANTEAKIMPQSAAEAVRTKKNRQGHIRQR